MPLSSVKLKLQIWKQRYFQLRAFDPLQQQN